jgi:hypothetical protein
VNGASIEHWLDDGADGEEARAAELDVEEARRRTWREIPAWNDFGRALCTRFLELAAAS